MPINKNILMRRRRRRRDRTCLAKMEDRAASAPGRAQERRAGREHTAEQLLSRGLEAGSVDARVTHRRLQDDPRPWKQKAARVAGLAALTNAGRGRPELGQLIGAQRAAAPGRAAGNASGDVAAEFGENLSGSVWDLGTAGGIEVAIALRSGALLAQQWSRESSFPNAGAELSRAAVKTAGEEIAFMLAGLAGGAMVPEPVLGGLWVSYRMGKAGLAKYKERETMRRCLLRRMEALHRQAQASVAADP